MDLIKVLNDLTNKGYCPALIFDDDGRWALAFDGTQPVNFTNDPQSMYTTFFVDEDSWKNTIKEAVEYAINKQGVDK